MKFCKEASPYFIEQFQGLGVDAQRLVRNKIDQILENPTSNKRLRVPGQVYRVRFSDRRADKRLVYEIVGKRAIFHCILDRKDGYQKLHRYLTKRS